ncbi:MAG: molybdenum cofactor biosynthesis protein MoaE [Xanthomonadales bacterium]|nr:molybdenum cofactor biosynthesis protein MoaE [Gammaproteobacteria bacterium]NND56529.1 molybdenum cofactor biosynthesis protein MoaE [Xanthomonadales bacterium]
MKSFEITGTAIDLGVFRQRLLDHSCGAYVQFEGWVRDHNEGRKVLRLEYEVYEPLAVKEGNRIIDEAIARFGVTRACAIHRSGLMELSEAAVVVGVSSPHRGEAFDACRYIIDQAKARLPIWKKEYYESGMAEWVNCQRCAHPA